MEVMLGKGLPIGNWSTPLVAGTESSHSIFWKVYDSLCYVSVRAISRTGVTGHWSNTVAVFVPYPSTSTTEINTKGSTQPGYSGDPPSVLVPPHYEERRNRMSSFHIILIISAAIAALLIVLAFALYYVIFTTKKRRQQVKKTKDPLDSVTIACPAHDPESETDSISKQPAESLARTETPTTDQRPLSPVQSWTASKLLSEHEKRCPSEAGGNEVPDLGVPYQPHPFYYHTPNGNYIEDTIPIDSGSMVSTQPSDSLLVYKLDSSTTESLRPASSPPIANTPVSWDSSRGRPILNKVPPPTLPKPSITSPLDLCAGNTGTLGHERRRRNVTQV